MAIKAVETAGPEEFKSKAETEYNTLRQRFADEEDVRIDEAKWVSTQNCWKGKAYFPRASSFENSMKRLGYKGPVKPAIDHRGYAFKDLPGGFKVTVVCDPKAYQITVSVSKR